VLFPPGPPDLRQLGDVLERHGVTTLWLTAGLFHQMVESHLESLRSVRQLAAGGDVLSPVHVRRALAGLPGLTLINGYGPTEGTTFTCCHVMGSEADLGLGAVPIGRPIANTRVYLLDAMFQPVPVGVVGQLYAAGDGLARGYAGRPDLTAERFVPDPVSGEAGTRLYATGDLARWRPSGEIEFLGRADSQVKIRGFRIEPGEIEAVLAGHPEVDTPLVTVREDVAGDRRLVAYVVPAAGRPPEPAALRAWAEEWLPSYMVPSAFVLLSELPLGATGKVDRRALPAPARERSEPERPGERSAVEELLAGIWCDLLGIPGVAPQESFFELGGHSLLATRMVSRIRAVLGLELPLRAVFEEPTLAGLAALAERVRRGDAGTGMPPLVRVPRSGPLPASFSQQRLWFLDRLEPGSIAFNIPRTVRLEGPLDVAALAGALSGIVSRHESLRTTFVEQDGEPWQVIAEAVLLPLAIYDLAGLPAAARQQEARRLGAAEARRPFDLARGPLLRSALLRLGEREHVLLAGMHHIVSDGWSMGIFVRELGELYRGLASGEPAGLPELPIQYADFAAWQRQWLRGEVMEERLAWWTVQLAGTPQVADLPLDRPRPPIQSYQGGRAQLAIGPDLEERLEAVTRRLGVTPFMALLAVFATLLRRYGSQDDIVVGTPIANREREELETLIGMFVNTLALRVDLSGDPDFAELARRVREMALGAYTYQDVPFERLVEDLRPERSLSHAPVFQVVLALQNLPEANLDLGDVVLSRLPADPGTTQVDLGLFLIPSPQGGLLAQMEYASDLFEPGTAERLLGHFHRLLEGVTAEGADGVRISELPLLSGEEREQVVREWNRTAAEIPDEPVHRTFRQWAERRPDALAVSWSGGRLSYGELAYRADCLARRLRERGVGPETLVALCFERSPELIAAAVAVLEAGGAYLPIDPAQPAERLEWIVRDSAAAFLLTPESLTAMERESPREETDIPADMPADAGPDGLVYVIYTSGSTGMPKGAELRHRGLSSMMAWNRRYHGIGPEDRNTFLAGPGFDASVWELWGALTSGASLHIPPPELIPAPAALLRWMAAEGITVSFLPTPITEAVLAERLSEELSLRVLIVAGDRLVRRPAPDAPFALFNLYGPSENTVTATASRVSPFGDRAPDIGTPVANTRAYIVDRFLQPVPVGAPGELCLAGEGVARSYRFRPQLTADRFVPDPFGGAGERLYRTGDLARWRPDGQIEFLGRVDFQVKIRGFRIELGEVETALTRQLGVESAVVLAREDGGEKRLVAYVVGPAGGTSAEELRRGLQQTLPEPMLPSAFVFLEAFPLTQHGKVDRRALPAPERAQHGSGAEFVPPRTPLEEEVAQVWRDVLKVDRIGVSDSFWELGGHSLLATRVLSRIEELFEVDLPLRTLFASPSLGEFAAMVGERVLVREGGQDIDAALAELNDMSEDEIRALLEQEARELEEIV
jgi:amino acid adenylation domain-containing protein